MEQTRLVVNITPRTAEAISSAAQYEETRRTDVINRAIQLYDFLKDKEVHVFVPWKFGFGKFGWLKKVTWHG